MAAVVQGNQELFCINTQTTNRLFSLHDSLLLQPHLPVTLVTCMHSHHSTHNHHRQCTLQDTWEYTLTLSRAAVSMPYSSTTSRTTSACPPWAARCTMLFPSWSVSRSEDCIFGARCLMISAWPLLAAWCRALRPRYKNRKNERKKRNNNPVVHALWGLTSEYMTGSALCPYIQWMTGSKHTDMCTCTRWSN